MKRALTFAAALLALGALTPAIAGAAEQRANFEDVQAALMCDVCGVPLANAESPRAEQQREEVRTLIAQGLTKQQILDRMAATWGPDVLAVPSGGGASVTVWAIPAGAVAAVLLGLLIALPRWRRRTREPEPAQLQVSDEDAQRLERDLAAYDR